MLGIGGGGDIVGALAIGRYCESLGTPFELGGVAWERFAVDPYPGPRPIDQIRGGQRLDAAAVLADATTGTEDGLIFSESRMAGFLNRAVVLLDVTQGATALGDAIVGSANALDCDLVVSVDVGGDVLAHGQEPNLASPLCDAILLAAAVRAGEHVSGLGAVFGAGCDGELTTSEVLERIAGLARAGAWLGTWSLPADIADELDRAAALVPTEASLQAVRCARGETGDAPIRDGRRHVALGPIGALTFFFDPATAFAAEAPLARAVADAADLDSARDVLEELGVRSELDYERTRAA